MNKSFESNVNSNRNGTDKVNSISKNLTKVKESFDFFRVSDIPNRTFRVRLCTNTHLGCAY